MTANLVFAASTALFTFIVAGYPALLWLRTRSRRRPSLAPDAQAVPPTVSVLLPVRNGEQWIGAKLDTLRALDYPAEQVEIIVISDGCTDSTENIVRNHTANAILITNRGSGKADALNTALPAAHGEILFLTDVRQPLDRSALSWLVAQFADSQIGAATGELMILSADGREADKAGLYWRYEKWIRKQHSAVDSVLGATGAIYAIRRSLALPLPPGTLLDDMLMPLQAFLAGYRIVFVPEARAFDGETDLGGEFRRKVRTQAGVFQLVKLCPGLLGPANRMWIHFVTHKLGRLLLPWLLLAAFVSSLFLPYPWAILLGGAQAAVLVLGLADPLLRGPKLLKKLSSLLRTFLVLMGAAMCAVSIFFIPPGKLWKSHRPVLSAANGARRG